MKVLTINAERTEELKNTLCRNVIRKLNNGTLKEDQLAVVIDEVYKLGRTSIKR